MAVGLHALGIIPATHRYKMFQVQPYLLVGLLVEMDGQRLVHHKGMPADSRVVETRFNILTQTIEMVIESAEFEEVAEGQDLPDLIITTTVTQGFDAIVNELAERAKEVS